VATAAENRLSIRRSFAAASDCRTIAIYEYTRALARDVFYTWGDQSAPRIAASKEGVPAMFGRVVLLNLINDFATNRTKSNMNPPTAVPYITEAGT
jgi:hypothetical protein